MQEHNIRKRRYHWALLTTPLVLSLAGTGLGGTPATLLLPSNATCEEIQKALDSFVTDGEVVLSAGTYEVSRPLLVQHDGATLRGSGLKTILHLADNAACPVVVLGPAITSTNHQAAHLHLADLMIDGNRKNQRAEFWKSAGDGSEIMNNGVQVWSATDAVVEHVVCCRCRSGGLVAASTRRLVVRDFDAYDNQFDGLACYQTEDGHFSHLRLHDNLGAGVSLDLDFNHNFITDATLADNDLGVFMRDSRNNSFATVTITKSHHHGVFMAQSAVATPKGWILAPGTECTGNSFNELKVNDCGGQAFLVNDASCTNNAISGAMFLGNARGLGQPARNVVNVQQMVER